MHDGSGVEFEYMPFGQVRLIRRVAEDGTQLAY